MSPLHSAIRGCCPNTLRTCFAFLLLVSSLGFLLGVNGQAFGQCPPAPDMEIDGNAVDDPLVPGLDWDSVLGYNGFAGVQGTDTLSTDLIDDSWDPDSTTFTQGSADFDPISGPGGWTCVVGEVKGKNDIQNGAGVLFPDKIFYFMLDRLAIEGDAQIGFWLLGDDVDCHSEGSGSGAEDFVGNHQVNDLLVQIDFLSGGTVGDIKIWRWTGSGTLDTVSVNVTTGLACAVVNQEVIQAPWGVEQKNFDPADCPFPDVNGKGGCYGINTSPQGAVAGAFFEGYIDLQALLGGELCTQTFIGETRSSQSPTASRDDWVRGAFVTKPTCEIADTTVCFTGNPTSVQVEADIVMPAGIVPFTWSVISGTATIVDPAVNPVTVQFASPGSATLQLIVGNLDCADTCSAVVTVSPAPTCTISGADAVCADSENNVYTSSVNPAGGTVTYAWSISGQGTIDGSTTGSSVSVDAGAAGSFTLTLDVTRDGCPGQCQKTVTVNANPTCTISGPDPVCADSDDHVYTSSVNPSTGTITYAWSISGQGTIDGPANGSSVTVDAGSTGSYTLTLDIMREGCPGQCQKTVTVNPNPTCTISGPNAVCEGESAVQYTSSVNPSTGTITYAWSISGQGNIVGSATGSSVTVDPTAAGSFTLTLDVLRDGCPGQCQKTVTVNPGPTCTISGPDPVCADTEDHVYTSSVNPSTGTITYAWSISGQGTIDGPANGSSVTVDAGSAGSYTLDLTVTREGCVGTCSKTVTVNANPTCTISGPDPVCADSEDHVYTSSVNPSTGTITYAWSISGQGTIDGPANGSSVTVDAGSAGSYTLTLDVLREGCPGQCQKTVTVNANPTCTISGPDPVCADSENHVYTSSVNPSTGTITYAWSISGQGTIDGSASGSSVTVDAGSAGSYTLTLDVVRNGCPGQCQKTVTVNPGPTCTISGPDPVCADSDDHVYTSSVNPSTGTITYAWSISGQGTIDGSANGSSVTVDAGSAGSYTLTLDITREGCPGQCQKTVTVNANPTCTISGPDPVCADSDDHVYTSSVNPSTGTITYAWSISGQGTIDGSANGSSVTVDAGSAGSFTLTLDVLRNGCPGQCQKTVTVNANPTCSLDGNLEPCTGQDETYTSSVSPSDGTITYSWSVVPSDCGTIVGSSSSSSVVVNWAHSGPCTLRLEITRNDCPGVCELTINPQNCNDEFCSFTQGYWGNEGGQKCFNDQQTGTLAILQALITPGNPLVIGKLGQRSITFGDGDEQCIIDLLPGGGSAGALPESFGDEEIGANCQTDPAIPTNPKSGRIRNILLSQTIALALNVRFDEGLCDLELCRYMTTVDADPGPDECLGNDDDSPTLSGILTFEISQTLLDYLGADATVCDLLTLANCKLAGDANLPDATLIAGAVGAINEGFDECRFLTECGPNPPFEQATGPIETNRDRLDHSGAGFGEGVPVKFGLFGALPNPTRALSMIRFALPEASNVRLTLYNIRGQEMKVLVNGVMEQGYKTVGLEMQGLPSGIYLYRLEAKGMESGAQFRESQKVLLIQ